MLVYMSGMATATAAPQPGHRTPVPGKATIVPFPEPSETAPGLPGNQTADRPQAEGNATATPGAIDVTPVRQASASAAPGFETVAAVVCLIGAGMAARRRLR